MALIFITEKKKPGAMFHRLSVLSDSSKKLVLKMLNAEIKKSFGFLVRTQLFL